MTTPPKIAIPNYPEPTSDDIAAAARFAATMDNDPFPDIPPALLNSAHIFDYVRCTGMVCPFYPARIKSASYPVRIGTQVISWDENGKQVDRLLEANEEFTAPPNSIIFLTTHEKFRLPNYIAIRFNLHIEFVHRGILLGTGPLVDPGFEGQLLIPLHNLTTNPYKFRQGQEIIWIEFTKTSAYSSWDPNEGERTKGYKLTGQYVPFEEQKKWHSAWSYLNKARKYQDADAEFMHQAIRSSIPDAIATAQKLATQAQNEANRARLDAEAARDAAERIASRYTKFGVITVIGLGVAVFAVYLQLHTLIFEANKIAGSMREDFSAFKAKVESQLGPGNLSKRDPALDGNVTWYQAISAKLGEMIQAFGFATPPSNREKVSP